MGFLFTFVWRVQPIKFCVCMCLHVCICLPGPLVVCLYTAHFVAEAQGASVEGSPLDEAPASLDQIKSCINPLPEPNVSSGPAPISKPLLWFKCHFCWFLSDHFQFLCRTRANRQHLASCCEFTEHEIEAGMEQRPGCGRASFSEF